MPLYPQFAELLNHYLREQDRTVSWLAGRLGVHASTVSRWSDGVTRPDSPETVVRIADCLHVPSGTARGELLAAAGYAAVAASAVPVSAVAHRNPLVRVAGRAAARAPGWLAAPLLAQPAVYAAVPWQAPDILTGPGCGSGGLDLGQQRLAISSAFGSYFAGLLERHHSYVDLPGQIDAPAPSGLEQLPPFERMAWALNHPRGPRALVVAAEAGMGKSTLAAQLLRCLLQQRDFDLLIGDSAKQSRVDLSTGSVESLLPGFWNVNSCFARLRSQLGLPYSDSAATSDIGDRLAGRRVLIVIDNLESVTGRDELLRRLGRLLNRDVRAVLTTRQIDALPAFSQVNMLVHLQPLTQVAALDEFLRWHVQRHDGEQPLLRALAQQAASARQRQLLLARTGGIPLLVQLVYSTIARVSWAYLDHLPRLYGDELLAFLYRERWEELESAGAAGCCALDLLRAVAGAQVKGERVDLAYLQQWAERSQSAALLPLALNLLYERFLLLNSDQGSGNFALFPSLVEFVLRSA